MKKNEKDIIQYLCTQNQKVTASELSRILNFSVRTIKTYIANLNSTYPNLIVSTNRGYLVDKEKGSTLLHEKSKIPQDYDSRCIFLIKRILLEKQKSLNVFDICDELFISHSTLKNDLSKMNTSFISFELSFYCKDNTVLIKGNEKNKRKLISHVMSEEVSDNFLDFMFLQKSFPEYDLQEFSKIVKGVFKKYNYYINDFSFINLLMHIVVMVNRIQTGNHIENKHIDVINITTREKKIVSILCESITSFFHISLNQSEQFEINILVNSSINYNLQSSSKQLKDVVSEDIISLSEKLIQKVDNQFFINLMSSSFITPFTLHLKNLKARLENNTSIHNPMHDSIKNSCPTIYDISTYLAYQIMLEFDKKINKDEIAFLALHVGTEIERQKKSESIISCVLLCPEYLGVSDILYNKLLIDFGEQINIVKIVSFESELNGEFDLLITTIPTTSSSIYLTVTLPPLPINYSHSVIDQAIKTIENEKKGEYFANNIDRYFNDNLFYVVNDETPTKREIIDILSSKMISLGFVEENFKEEVLKRESASSTAFMKIAIPHPMKMSAYKTSVAVLICKKGVEWDQNHIVHIVFMIAFNKIDNHHFHKLYESLILLFNEDHIIEDIKKCKNLSEFKSTIIKNCTNT